MGVLVWWILPAVSLVLAVTWAAWVRRPPRRLGDAETVAAYARFRAALAPARVEPPAVEPRVEPPAVRNSESGSDV